MTEPAKWLCYNQPFITMTSFITAISGKMRPSKFTQFSAIALFTIALAGCGGGAPTPQPTTTGLKKRVLLSNQQTGTVIILDAINDKFSSASMTIGGASRMATSGGFTSVIDSNQNLLTIVDNTKEAATANSISSDRVVDTAMSKDGKTAYAAVRNTGAVNIVNTADGGTTSLNVPSVSRLVLSPNGTKLLAFVDDPNASVSNPGGFFVIDTANKTVTPISGPALDQPFTGVFNGSETQAFILNCGPECGGTAASVVRVDFSAAPAFSAPIPVSAATVGLLNGSTLFVAGTPVPAIPPATCNGAGLTKCGTLQGINTGTLIASAPVIITDGQHVKMQMAGNNRLYVGAVACTSVNDGATGLNKGCLTIFNTGASTAVFPEFTASRTSFDVTGLQPISSRNVVYVCEGGELDIYDTTTDKLTPNQLDVVGKGFDVVQIDP